MEEYRSAGPLPWVLQGALRASQGKLAGEWTLHVPSLTLPHGYIFPMAWARQLVREFRVAFSWLAFRKIDMGIDEQRTAVWHADETSLDDWLASRALDNTTTGVEAVLDLTAHWSTPDGASGQAVLPGAAALWFDLSPPRPLSWTLQICPNVFTNEIYICELVRQPPCRFIGFKPAAQMNRTLLQTSLQTWERLSGGQIVLWESNLVESGIERYGFREDARPF